MSALEPVVELRVTVLQGNFALFHALTLGDVRHWLRQLEGVPDDATVIHDRSARKPVSQGILEVHRWLNPDGDWTIL